MLQLIDTHIHLDLLSDAEAECAEARQRGVTRFIVPGTRVANWSALIDSVATIPGASAAPGVHPMDAGAWEPSDMDRLRQLLGQPATVALGEVGLDRRIDVPREIQEKAFRQMIRIACETGKPLLLHNREATGRLLELQFFQLIFRPSQVVQRAVWARRSPQRRGLLPPRGACVRTRGA